MDATQFQLQPRLRNLPRLALLVGAAFVVLAILDKAGDHRVTAAIFGAFGLGFFLLHQLSPTRRLSIVVDDTHIGVDYNGEPRFRVLWTDIVRVVHSPRENSCFIDSGTPETSVLVPGKKIPSAYDVANAEELMALVLARVGDERVETVNDFRAAQTAQQVPAKEPS